MLAALSASPTSFSIASPSTSSCRYVSAGFVNSEEPVAHDLPKADDDSADDADDDFDESSLVIDDADGSADFQNVVFDPSMVSDEPSEVLEPLDDEDAEMLVDALLSVDYESEDDDDIGPADRMSEIMIKYKDLPPRKLRRICLICDRKFPTEATREIHETCHFNPDGSGDGLYQCSACHVPYRTLRSLRKHEYYCNVYREMPEFLRLHLQSIHDRSVALDSSQYAPRKYRGEGGHKCDECGRSFPGEYALKIHKVCHQGGEHMCSGCNAPYRSFRSLRRHELFCEPFKRQQNLLVGEGESLNGMTPAEIKAARRTCDVCHKEFNSEKLLETHRKCHENATFRCALCNVPYRSLGSVRRHEYYCKRQSLMNLASQTDATDDQVVAANAELAKLMEKHTCRYCNKKVSTEEQLQQHLKKHEGGTYICDRCSVPYTSIRSLRRHSYYCMMRPQSPNNPDGSVEGVSSTPPMIKTHRSWKREKLVCSYCQKEFSNQELLDIHMECHDGGQYVCSLCMVPYRSLRSLRRHQYFCQKSRNAGLENGDGMATPKGTNSDAEGSQDSRSAPPTPLSALFSSAAFMTPDMRVVKPLGAGSPPRPHDPSKPKRRYTKSTKENTTCTYCKKTFSCAAFLEMHMRCHEGDRTMICDQCNVPYRSLKSLRRHQIFCSKRGDSPRGGGYPVPGVGSSKMMMKRQMLSSSPAKARVQRPSTDSAGGEIDLMFVDDDVGAVQEVGIPTGRGRVSHHGGSRAPLLPGELLEDDEDDDDFDEEDDLINAFDEEEDLEDEEEDEYDEERMMVHSDDDLDDEPMLCVAVDATACDDDDFD